MKQIHIFMFFFFLQLIITLGSITILACYTSYVSFHMPCHVSMRIEEKLIDQPQVYQHSHGNKQNTKGLPINAYLEADYHLLAVTILDALSCALFILSTLVLCGDAREEAIQDEYVARVRASIYWNDKSTLTHIARRLLYK